MKKQLLLFFIGLIPLLSSAQFIKYDEKGCDAGRSEASKLEDILAQQDATGLIIYFHYDMLMENDLFSQLSNLKNPPEFKKLECVVIKFAMDPQLSDSIKMAFIKNLKNSLVNLQFLFKSPNMKNVYFSIGEQIFLTQAEIKKYKYKKYTSMNIKKAWEALGKDFQKANPKLKLYGEHFNW